MIIDPALWEQSDMRSALAVRDISGVYRGLRDTGVSQRQIAQHTGQSQSDVSEITKGRVVKDYRVLERIAEGLGIPREYMGLSYGEDGAYRGDITVADTPDEVSEDMKRAHFIAALAAAAFGQPVLMELLDPAPAAPGAVPLPSRLDMNHVRELRAWTEQLRLLARQHGGQADIVDAVANRSVQLMAVPGADPVKSALGSALAELHTVAGWTCFDSGLHHHARHHFTRAAELAGHADDPYGVAYALYHAGGTLEEIGYPNEALKAFQLSQFRLADAHDDPRVPALAGWLHAEAASAYAHLGHLDMARDGLAAARDGWEPPTADERADMEWLAALIERDLGRLDVAEQLAASSVRHWSGSTNRRDAALPSITLATIYVQAGEPRGPVLARSAINAVAPLHSARARQRLLPLATALDTRPGSDAQELARMARQVAATRV